MVKLNKEFLDSIYEEYAHKTFWDDTIKGFGLRIQKKSKSWILKYRNQFGYQKMYTIASVNKLPADKARKKAKELLAEITANYIDPASEKVNAKSILSVAELCELYIYEGLGNKKTSTIINDKSRIKRHILPLIGNLPIKSITKATIEKLILDIEKGKTAITEKSDKKRGLAQVRGGKSIAKRTIEMFGSILSFAQRRGLINENPVIGVPKPKSNKRECFLTIKDFTSLGKALHTAQLLKLNQTGINAIHLLALTGCRKDEILSLRWEYVDFENQCFRFPDTKTGKQNRAFGCAAYNLLKHIKEDNSSEWVFPATRGNGYFIGILKLFNKICALRPLKKQDDGSYSQDLEQSPFISKVICIHTLRHSFASVAADMGFIELTIAGLLGHKLGGVTNRYSHNVDSSLINAADRISLKIEAAISGEQQQTTAKIYNIAKEA